MINYIKIFYKLSKWEMFFIYRHRRRNKQWSNKENKTMFLISYETNIKHLMHSLHLNIWY